MVDAMLGILLYPGAQMSAVLGLTDIFEVARRVAATEGVMAPRLRVRHLKIEMAAALPTVSFDSDADGANDDSIRFAILILPPSLDPPIEAHAAENMVQWLSARYSEGTILVSICAGAFVLAETGLLNGRAVTTHWAYSQALKERHPEVLVDTDRLIIDGGDIISAGGLMSWTDIGLKLVDRFFGPAVMSKTARAMLMDPPGREQRYYSGFVPCTTHGDAAVIKAQHFLQTNEGREARISILAAEAGLEERTFLRRFQRATGLTATDYAQRLRVAKAQEFLQFGQQTIENIAWEVGYTDAGAFRKIFTRIVGLSPGAYRRRFIGKP